MLVHDTLGSLVTFGAGLGPLLGKPIGIVLASLAVWIGFAALPEGVTFTHILGAGLLAGIGFTVSLFIAGLAFDSATRRWLKRRSGVLAASLFAGSIGYLCLSIAGKPFAR